jgi:hypothetical protein
MVFQTLSHPKKGGREGEGLGWRGREGCETKKGAVVCPKEGRGGGWEGVIPTTKTPDALQRVSRSVWEFRVQTVWITQRPKARAKRATHTNKENNSSQEGLLN